MDVKDAAMVISAIGVVAAAVAAWVSAVQAKNAVREMHKDLLVRLTDRLRTQYESPRMLAAMVGLRSWKSECGDEFASVFKQQRISHYENIRRIDLYRRRISHFVQKVFKLSQLASLSEEHSRIIISKGTAEFILEIIVPLENAINPEHDKTPYEWLRQLYSPDKTPIRIAGPGQST